MANKQEISHNMIHVTMGLGLAMFVHCSLGALLWLLCVVPALYYSLY